MKEVEYTGEIEVEDQAGNRLTLEELTTFTVFERVDGPRTREPGSREYLLEGFTVSGNSDGTFTILETGQVLRRRNQ